MRKLCMVIVFLAVIKTACAQCLSGDCNNGKGKFDFGWCVYEGDFKNGKPDGQGAMKYDDYTYTGHFSNGVEDGQGEIVRKNGVHEKVIYAKGVRMSAGPVTVSAANWKELQPADPACLSGNCITGTGTYKYDDGNVYTGEFVNHERHGRGAIKFVNGASFEGTSDHNKLSSGKMTFSNGYTFTGTWNSAGDAYNGVYLSPGGVSVQLVNGRIIPPAASQMAAMRSAGGQKPSCQSTITCSHCHGRGYESKPIVQNLSWSTSSTYSVNSYGDRKLEYQGQSGRNSYTIPNYVACGRCGGSGSVCR